MHAVGSEVRVLRTENDIVVLRQFVRARAVELGLSLVDQTKLVTAASEIGRNAVVYGGGGTVRVEEVHDGRRRGLRLAFEDAGPGIEDLERAMRDGFSTAHGLGLGLGGAKRLVNEFHLDSRPGEGTRVTLVKWK